MTVTRDLFVHLGETLTITANVIVGNSAANLASYTVQFASAAEWTTDVLQTLGVGTGIAIANAQTASIVVTFKPLANAGFTERDHVYQIRALNNSSNAVTIVATGKMFIRPSLFE